jgi:hypothetical protein
MEKAKNMAIVAVFLALVFGIAALSAILPDAVLSRAERRKLAQKPALDAESVMNGKFMTGLEEYLLDQFPGRDGWRTIKAAMRFGLFRQMDNNGVYLVGDSVFKLEYPLKEEQVRYAAKKIAEVYEQYLSGMRVYWSVVPDKNYFAAEESGRMALDYDRLMVLMREGVPGNLTYVDLFDLLTLDDYYKTDAHWRQERIYKVAEQLAKAMGAVGMPRAEEFESRELSPFYGGYWGQSALSVAPDTLVYLESAYTKSAVVQNAEKPGESLPVYTLDRFDGMDGYDVFLDGAAAIITMTCETAKTDKELIIFRDSSASSLAPLLLGAYKKITLVDLWYIRADLVERYVDFADQDVLFLYGVALLNSGTLLK